MVRDRIELSTFRFSGWQAAGSGQGRARSPRRSKADIGDKDQGVTVSRCHVPPGATLGATRDERPLGLRTAMNNGQGRARGHELI